MRLRTALVPLILPLLACGLSSSIQGVLPTSLPPTRPADFRVSVSSSGGMFPLYTQATCGPTTCEASRTDHGTTTRREGPVSDADLDALYAVVRDHRFDRITMEHHEVLYDAGGTSIVVTAGGTTWSFGASATESVSAASQPDFDAVAGAVGALVAKLPP